jgi:hypothetical protein
VILAKRLCRLSGNALHAPPVRVGKKLYRKLAQTSCRTSTSVVITPSKLSLRAQAKPVRLVVPQAVRYSSLLIRLLGAEAAPVALMLLQILARRLNLHCLHQKNVWRYLHPRGNLHLRWLSLPKAKRCHESSVFRRKRPVRRQRPVNVKRYALQS